MTNLHRIAANGGYGDPITGREAAMLRTPLTALAAIPFVVAACGGSSGSTTTSTSSASGATATAGAATTGGGTGAAPAGTTAGAAATKPAEITAETTKYGKAIADAKGMTLYLFKPDTTTKSTCYGACAVAWPPLLTKGTPKIEGSGLEQSRLGVTTRTDGTLQVTYGGHPLYYFIGDKSAGAITGQNLNANGGLWLLVKPNGAADTAA
jgi:predicted lipoprotein with Yx(FWY)xxD motif